MAGHSKWANIKHKKANQDAKRGKLFTKLTKEIQSAVRQSGPDTQQNSRLRLAILKANQGNVPKDNIQKAIDKASGNLDNIVLETMRYEGYGPHGVAIMVDTLSDNKNRTVAEVRHAFTKHQGNLSTTGAVAYLFQHYCYFYFKLPQSFEEQLFELSLEHGALDIHYNDEGIFEVQAPISALEGLQETYENHNLKPDICDVNWDTEEKISLQEDAKQSVDKLIERLEDLDDVQAVYSNLDE
jgi:YebC/PmpR family DNA-binding regulatory protein